MEKLDCPACGTPPWQDSVGEGPFECGTCGLHWKWEDVGWTVLSTRSGKSSSADAIGLMLGAWLESQLRQFTSLFGVPSAQMAASDVRSTCRNCGMWIERYIGGRWVHVRSCACRDAVPSVLAVDAHHHANCPGPIRQAVSATHGYLLFCGGCQKWITGPYGVGWRTPVDIGTSVHRRLEEFFPDIVADPNLPEGVTVVRGAHGTEAIHIDLVAEEVHRAVDEYLDEEAESGYLGERYRFEGGSTRGEPTTGNKAIGITDEEAAAIVSWSTGTETAESHRVMTALAARLSVPERGELAPDCICLPEGSAVVGYRMDAGHGVITEAFVAGPWGSPVSGRWLPWLGVPDREEPAPCRCGDLSGPVCALHPDHAVGAEDGTAGS